MEKWKNVYTFLTAGSYPLDYDKSQRQTLRRYASKFQIKDGELFFGTKRKVVKSMEEAMLLFKEFHSSPIGGHCGIRKTREAICSRFYWHGMSVNIQNWVLKCDQCQKVGKPLIAPQPLIKVSAVWELVGIDLTGPLPITADGFQYILTATDYFSKWVEAFPLKTKSAAEVGRHLCSIIYRHGCPKRILSDQGREFVNELNHRLCEVLQIERSTTAAYHPQTNGLDEKTNDNIKRALKKLVNEQQSDWDVYLDATLFSLRSKVHTTTKHSPFLLMYGREAVFPSEVPVDVPDLGDIKPLSLLPEEKPIPITTWHHGDGGGEQHVLQEGVNSVLETIKTEPDPEEIGSGERPTLQHSEDNPMLSRSPTPVPKETWDYECKGERQYALEDSCRSLVVIKMEPDGWEPVSSEEHSPEPELREPSNLPGLWKTEPDDPSVPFPTHSSEDAQPRLQAHSTQRADRRELAEENDGLISSSELSQHSPAIGLGKELNGLKSYSCTECGNTFSKSSSFYRHMRIHTGERPYQCTQCNKTFIQSTSFKVHQRIHTGEKPYQCSDCGKTFRRLDNLQIHQRTHTGEKPYKCSHCPKTFTRLDVLQIHQRIHTGEKPYQCSHCCKTFTRLSVFQVHQRIHTGERPYRCTACGKHFVDASNLKNHERTHTLERPYRCSQCERTFIQLAHLTSHQRKHTGEKPYHCSICGKSYTASSTLLYHKRKHTVSLTPI